MKFHYYAFIFSLSFLFFGCGGDDSSSSITHSILASDGYIIDASVVSGSKIAVENSKKGIAWYKFSEKIDENIILSNGINDISPANGIPDNGEPYTPTLQSLSSYSNITPFTTMLLKIGLSEMFYRYPNAYSYDPTFNFDVVKLSYENLDIAKENAKASIELSIMENTKAKTTTRIINGDQVSSDDINWKFIVALKNRSNFHCAGSLIAPNWVLTAGHCLDFPISTVLTDSYSLVIGGEDIIVDDKIIYPDFDPITLDNDIGLLHLQIAVTSVSPIELNHKVPDGDTMVYVAGWGNMSVDSFNYPDNLMQVRMPVIDFEVCKRSYGDRLTNNMFCAGFMSGFKDSCTGDSGGPLILDENSTNLLSGIISFGGLDKEVCGAENYPGVYTRVANYIEWIESYTKNSSLSPSLENIFFQIDKAENMDEINAIIIKYMGYYNGTFPN